MLMVSSRTTEYFITRCNYFLILFHATTPECPRGYRHRDCSPPTPEEVPSESKILDNGAWYIQGVFLMLDVAMRLKPSIFVEAIHPLDVTYHKYAETTLAPE